MLNLLVDGSFRGDLFSLQKMFLSLSVKRIILFCLFIAFDRIEDTPYEAGGKHLGAIGSVVMIEKTTMTILNLMIER